MRIWKAGVACALAIAMEVMACAQAGGPQITTKSVPNGSVGSSYSAQIVSNLGGSDLGPPTWSLAGGNLPPGISLTVASGPTAIISGIPTAAGLYTFSVVVTQMLDFGSFQSVEKAFSISISGGFVPSATVLNFAAPPNSLPAAQAVFLNTSAGTVPFSSAVVYDSVAPGNWLDVLPLTGTVTVGIPTALHISIDSVALTFPTGKYTATIQITDTTSSARPKTVAHDTGAGVVSITVTFVVSQNPLTVPTLMMFAALAGAPSPQDAQTLTVGGAAVPFTYSIVPEFIGSAGSTCSSSSLAPTTVTTLPWLLVNNSSSGGNGTGGQSLSLSVQPAGLAPGTYRDDLNIVSGGITYDVAIYVVISGTPLAPVAFTYALGGALPSAQGFTLSSGCEPIPTQFPNAAAIVATSDHGWLSVNQPSVPLPNASFAITASPTGLAPGNYVGVVAVTDDAGEVQLYSCTLTVAANHTSTMTALPHFAAQDIWTTGIFAVNTLATAGNFNITFRDDFGKLIGLPFNTGLTATLPGSLSGLGSAYFEASDSTKSLIDGWGQITADPGVVIQALFRENSNGKYFEAAVPSNGGSTEFEIPFDATVFAATNDQFFTGFAIANLDSVTPATVVCTARDSNGVILPNVFSAATGPPQLPSLGHWAGYLFPALAGKRGTIDCTSNTMIAATALRFIGTNAFSSLPVINKGAAFSGLGSGALPHFAAQDIWTTGIFVVNTGNASAQYSIAFHQDSGAPVTLPFATGASNNIAGTLLPFASAYYEASNPSAPLISGWAQITADPAIVIQALFRENSSGTYYEAAVPSTAGSREFEIPFDATTFAATGDQFFTGFAIANLDPSHNATVTCTARDGSGNVIPNAFTAVTGPPQLAPLGHWAGYLFPALTGMRGTIDCVSTTFVAGTALRFIGTNAFSSLPVILK